jgi:CheY-like chemotaxis protein
MFDGLSFLIVEDEPIIAFNLEDLLVSLGCHRVLVAMHMGEAFQLLADEDVDAAVLDVNIHGERS